MKMYLLFMPFLLVSFIAKSQNKNDSNYIPRTCLTIGVFQGGSLVGVDAEYLITPNFGLQGGAGFLGYAAAINYHLKPGARSSFISFNYIHQGIGNTYTQSILGPSFVYRSKKWFTAQIGLGARIGKGPAMDDKTYNLTPVLLLYSVGAYFVQ